MTQTAHSHPSEASESCPYCGQDITHDELVAIEARIAEEQQEKFNAREKQLNAQHMARTSELHKALAAKDDNAKAQLSAAQDAYHKQLADKDKVAAQQAEAARKAERDRLEKEHAHTVDKLATERKLLDAKEKQLSNGEEVRKRAHEAELQRQRKILAADHEKKHLEQKAAWEKENYRTQQKLADLKRQLEKKSNEELGDGAEVDLYNDLRQAFPEDVITQVKKGVAGADVKHEIHVDGRCCGKVVYDSKNRNDWKTAYAEQLRKDQLAEKADYAILATRKFPQNARELTTRDSVLLVNPARAVVLAHIVRDALVQLSSVKLSETGKKEKQDKLYEFVTSTRCMNLFTRVEHEVAHLRDVDEKEKKQQQAIRKQRAKHVGEVEKTVLGELEREIRDILGV